MSRSRDELEVVREDSERPRAVATTTLVWLDDMGTRWTTLVGKLSARLLPGSAAAIGSAAPLVPYDRLAADRRFVIEAGEVFPLSAGPALYASAGPFRLTLEAATPPHERRTFEIRAGENVGPSMSAPERSGLAPDLPTRSREGDLVIPSSLDPRYFMAAVASRLLPSLRGDERFTLETPSGRTEGTLPGMALVARVSSGAAPARFVALRFDMLVLDGNACRLSLVGRATVRGHTERFDVMMGPLARLTTRDVGDDPFAGRCASSGSEVDTEATQALSMADIALLRERTTMPFQPSAQPSTHSAGGRPRPSPLEMETEMLSPEAVDALRAQKATPFSVDAPGAPSSSSRQPSSVSATPFDAAHRPAEVAAADTADETLPILGAPALHIAQQLRSWLAEQRPTDGEVTAEADLPPPLVAPPRVAPPRVAPPLAMSPLVAPPPVAPPLAPPPLATAQPMTPASVSAAPMDPVRAAFLAKLDAGERLTGAKLAGQDLRGLVLQGVWLDGADLSRADLRGVDLAAARLDRAVFDDARVDEAKLEGATLQGASFRKAHLSGACFDRCQLDGACFEGAHGGSATFVEVRGARVGLSGAHLRASVWRGAQLADATAERADLQKADFTGAVLSGLRAASADLSHACLEKTDLSRAELSGATLHAARAQRADLSGAMLEKADLSEAELQKAQLTGAKLGRAKLDGASLDGARLGKADLRGASAARASFDDASMEGANLREVRATAASFQRAVLQNVDLERAELSKSRFDEADARSVGFRGAKLAGASFLRARLGDADLRDADLTGADLTDVEAAGARFKGAKLKDAKGAVAEGQKR